MPNREQIFFKKNNRVDAAGLKNTIRCLRGWMYHRMRNAPTWRAGKNQRQAFFAEFTTQVKADLAARPITQEMKDWWDECGVDYKHLIGDSN